MKNFSGAGWEAGRRRASAGGGCASQYARKRQKMPGFCPIFRLSSCVARRVARRLVVNGYNVLRLGLCPQRGIVEPDE
jgi:hypothetical protein